MKLIQGIKENKMYNIQSVDVIQKKKVVVNQVVDVDVIVVHQNLQ